jgi:hypothetical protein
MRSRLRLIRIRFLTTYVLSEGKNMRYAMSQVAAFYIGKMLAVAAVCTGGALLGNTLITGNGELAGFPLRRLVSLAMIITSLWLLRSWAGERKGCKNCRRCSAESRRIPSFTVGMAYGFSPCAPLMMVLGFSALLPVHSALLLAILFSLASSLIPAMITLTLSGALSVRISAQLGSRLPYFQLILYVVYLFSGIYGLIQV